MSKIITKPVDTETAFVRWVLYFKFISLFFAAFSVAWIFIGSFDPFGFYDKAFAQTFWHTETLPVDAQITFRFLLGPLGATNSGYFMLQYFVVKYAFSQRQRWSYQALITAFLTWFLLDTASCVYLNAYFNILFANVPALFAMAPIVWTRKYMSAH